MMCCGGVKCGLLVWCLSTLLWHVTGATSRHTDVERSRRAAESTITRKLRVVTIENEPYVMISNGANGPEYQGFVPELMFELSQKLHFSYEFYKSPDNKYGAVNPDGTWTGMMGEVIKNKHEADGNVSKENDHQDLGADVAAAPLTVTRVRQGVVNFIHPFHNLGLIMVAQTPRPDNTTDHWMFNFSILKPFSGSVWGTIILITIVVGLLLYGLNHFNPYEWGGRYNIGQANIHQKEAFNVSGSLWFVFSTLQWQGFERAPRSIASKILTCFWFAFVTLTLLTYIGSLVNNLWWASMALRHNPLQHPITDLADMVSAGKDFQYGAVRGGSTMAYVKIAAQYKAEFNVIYKHWQTEEGSKQLADNTPDGLKKVRAGNYAFMMETMSAKFHINQKPCDLTTLGEQFAKRSYGLAVPKNWPYLEAFNHAILEMIEDGTLDQLEQKWWEGRGECWAHRHIEKVIEKATAVYLNQAEPKSVDMKMFWGQLVVMLIGLIFTILAGAAEILYYRYKGKYVTSNRPQGQTLKLENEDGDGSI